MKTMALNSVRNSDSQMKSLSQLVSAMGKAISEYGKNEEVVAAILVVCVMCVVFAVAMNDVVMLVVSGGAFLLALMPMLYHWTKLPEDK